MLSRLFQNPSKLKNTPIDAVYTWVNGSDKEWIEKKKQAVINKGLNPESVPCHDSRYRDNEELRYSLRSLEKYAPWIRHIYIITDNQIPEWLDRGNDKVRIIDHRDVFHDKTLLPTFNSNAIEANLHHIKDLSETFLYFNDDVFLGNHAEKKDFFTNSCKPRIFVGHKIRRRSGKLLDARCLPETRQNEFQYAVINCRNLIFREFNKILRFTFRHGIKPMSKKGLFDLETIFLEEFNSTAASTFRSKENILSHALFGFYSIAIKQSAPFYLTSLRQYKLKHHLFPLRKKKQYLYINMSSDLSDSSLEFLLKRRPFMFCINDYVGMGSTKIVKMKETLQKYFPDKSSFEQK